MIIRAWGILSLSVCFFASCATTRYEEFGPLPEAQAGGAVDSIFISDSQMLTARIRAMELRLSDIESLIQSITSDQLPSADGTVMARLAELSEQIQELRGQIQSGRSPSTAAPAPANRRPAVQDVRVLYENALQAFDGQDYGQATQLFKQILTHDGKGHLADNAQYWLGECAYAVEDYTGSLEAFKRVFQFHETEKDDDAQLKLGFCYLKLGDSESALIEFKRLTVDYPQSEYLSRAEEQIRRIRAAKASKP